MFFIYTILFLISQYFLAQVTFKTDIAERFFFCCLLFPYVFFASHSLDVLFVHNFGFTQPDVTLIATVLIAFGLNRVGAKLAK